MTELMQRLLAGRNLTWQALVDLKDELKGVAVEVPWGNPEDWQAEEHVLTRAYFDAPHLRDLIDLHKVNASGDIGSSHRGCVVWLWALADEDIAWFRQKAAAVLGEAFPGENPLPVVLMLPSKPAPGLGDALLKQRALAQLSQDDRKEVGDAYDQELQRQRQAVAEGLGLLRGDLINYASLPRQANAWVAPTAYQAALQARGRLSLQQLLAHCYQLAYRYAPPEFQRQYRASGRGPNALRNAVRMMSAVLLRNNLASNYQVIGANAVARDLADKILLNSWRIVTADRRLQEPGETRILEAWRRLDEAFGAGRQDVPLAPVVAQLLNPPYGYDLNTLSLLISAWVGYNAQDLQVSLDGRQTGWEAVAQALNDNRAQLIPILLTQHARLSRRDQAQVEREIKETIKRAKRNTVSQDEARGMLASLQAYRDDCGPTAPSAESAQDASEHLGLALTNAEAYDRAARQVREDVDRERSAHALIAVGSRIAKLPQPGNVLPSEPGAERLRDIWLERLEALVDETCRNQEAIQRVAEWERNKENLEGLKKKLREAGLAEMGRRVDKSLRTLMTRGRELEIQADEAPIRAEILAMDMRVGLARLCEYRDNLKAFTVHSDDIRRLRDKKTADVKDAIKQQEDFAEGLAATADTLKSVVEVDHWLQRYYRAHEQYQDTPYYEQLSRAGSRAESLRQLLAEIERLANSRPSTPEEAEVAKRKLADLADGADANAAPAKSLVRQAIKQIEQHISQALEKTRVWLDELEYELSDSPSLQKIRDRLASPPAYMTPTVQKRWEKLRNKAEAHLDKDVVTRIEQQFRKISSQAVRRECIRRLQEILEDGPAR